MRIGGASATGLPATTPVMALQAATVPAGVAMVNGAQTFATWNAPNDGKLHNFTVAGFVNTTVLEVGGGVNVNWTSNGQAQTFNVAAGGAAVGLALIFLTTRSCDPGTVVTVTQAAALTGGAAVVAAAIVAQ